MRFGHGLVIGKFLPPHRGHGLLINTACSCSDQVTVIVCAKDADPIPGVCFNKRMQVIFCSADHNVILFRQAQIAAGLAPKCDPHYEAWLGCGTHT